MLADTSVWVDHFRRGNPMLVASLERGEVVAHPYIIGELACGQMKTRRQVIEMLSALPSAPVVSHEEAMHFLESHHLAGSGLGWIDVHLLAAATAADVRLWTLDARLADANRRVGSGG
jgi:hypothetical protein